MGMLMNRHRELRAQADSQTVTPAPRRRRRKTTQTQPPAPPASAYADLTDEQLEQAYTIMVDGSSYPGREDAIAALDAVDADGDGKRDDQQD